jgi:hypothetical protein
MLNGAGVYKLVHHCCSCVACSNITQFAITIMWLYYEDAILRTMYIFS